MSSTDAEVAENARLTRIKDYQEKQIQAKTNVRLAKCMQAMVAWHLFQQAAPSSTNSDEIVKAWSEKTQASIFKTLRRTTYGALLSTHSALHTNDLTSFVRNSAIVQALITIRQLFAPLMPNAAAAKRLQAPLNKAHTFMPDELYGRKQVELLGNGVYDKATERLGHITKDVITSVTATMNQLCQWLPKTVEQSQYIAILFKMHRPTAEGRNAKNFQLIEEVYIYYDEKSKQFVDDFTSAFQSIQSKQ
jgi:hypothetical protein